MPVDNQIVVPPSFMALYILPGQNRPAVSQAVILARYDCCEDMACMLSSPAQNMAYKEWFSEREVLLRCYKGLLAEETGFSEKEAGWIIYRLAELTGWEPPELFP